MLLHQNTDKRNIEVTDSERREGQSDREQAWRRAGETMPHMHKAEFTELLHMAATEFPSYTHLGF